MCVRVWSTRPLRRSEEIAMPPNTIFLITTNPTPAVAGTTRRLLGALLVACTLGGCGDSDEGADPDAGAAGMAGMGGTGGEGAPTGGTGGAGGGQDALPNGCTGNCWSYMGFGAGS